MRHLFHEAMYLLCVMHALFILVACKENQAKEQKTPHDVEGRTEEYPELTDEVLNEILNAVLSEDFFEESFNTSRNTYTFPTCKQPYVQEVNWDNSTSITAWRNEVEQIKAQIFNQMNGVGLTQDFAVQLALVNNPNLLAFYENLEIGYAHLLEAGLRHNPGFKDRVRFPEDPAEDPEHEWETSNDFLDFFLIPFRENVAIAELEVIEAQLGQMVLDLAKEVRINWVLVKTLEMEIYQGIEHVELKALASELATLQKKAGNVGGTTERKFRIAYELDRNKLEIRLADLEVAREKLNRSLGLFGPEICFTLAGGIDWRNDYLLPDLFGLEQAAIENRLDIEAIRREIVTLAEKAKLKEPWTYTRLKTGHSFKKNSDGSTLFGPQIQLEVPIYNFGQAEREKYHALIEQAQKKLVAKAVEACSKVREFVNILHIYRSELELFEQGILPDFKEQLESSIVKHNTMTLGVFELFEIKGNQTDAIIEYIHTLRRYVVANIELFHAIGGDFEIIKGGARK